MSRKKHAFTLIELLVVVSIVSVLIGLLMPALAAARRQAKMACELAGSRQLGQAYIGYALDHGGRLLPGMADEPATDGRGNVLPFPVNERYPWRLMGHIDHGIEGSILVNEQAEALAAPPPDASASELWHWRYNVSIYPSFGLNYFYLGGDRRGGADSSLYLRKIDQAVQPSRMIVFGSARSEDGVSVTPGFFRITAPQGPTSAWADQYRESDTAGAWGFVHPRWGGSAVFAHLDGHSELLDTQQMRDMTRWSNQAAIAGDPGWTPSP